MVCSSLVFAGVSSHIHHHHHNNNKWCSIGFWHSDVSPISNLLDSCFTRLSLTESDIPPNTRFKLTCNQLHGVRNDSGRLSHQSHRPDPTHLYKLQDSCPLTCFWQRLKNRKGYDLSGAVLVILLRQSKGIRKDIFNHMAGTPDFMLSWTNQVK